MVEFFLSTLSCRPSWEFPKNLLRAKISPVILVKSDFSSLRNWRIAHRKHLWQNQFLRYLGGRLDSSECLKRTLLKSFFWELFETVKTAVFPNIIWESIKWLLRCVLILDRYSGTLTLRSYWFWSYSKRSFPWGDSGW